MTFNSRNSDLRGNSKKTHFCQFLVITIFLLDAEKWNQLKTVKVQASKEQLPITTQSYPKLVKSLRVCHNFSNDALGIFLYLSHNRQSMILVAKCYCSKSFTFYLSLVIVNQDTPFSLAFNSTS